jgi:hypothetical protein
MTEPTIYETTYRYCRDELLAIVTAMLSSVLLLPGCWGKLYPQDKPLNYERKSMKRYNLKGKLLPLTCNPLGMRFGASY